MFAWTQVSIPTLFGEMRQLHYVGNHATFKEPGHGFEPRHSEFFLTFVPGKLTAISLVSE